MKLKLLQTPNRGQKDMVCHTNFGTFEATVGQVLEVKDQVGHAILSLWPSCFQVVLDTAQVTTAPAKVSGGTPEEKAAAEATKMVQGQGYQNKKAETRV